MMRNRGKLFAPIDVATRLAFMPLSVREGQFDYVGAVGEHPRVS
ncbi:MULTISPECIES: hypothetical protein [Bradyrhizobium]|nr:MULTISPECIES: hypothetical protein [Bradyrhizobium]